MGAAYNTGFAASFYFAQTACGGFAKPEKLCEIADGINLQSESVVEI